MIQIMYYFFAMTKYQKPGIVLVTENNITFEMKSSDEVPQSTTFIKKKKNVANQTSRKF